VEEEGPVLGMSDHGVGGGERAGRRVRPAETGRPPGGEETTDRPTDPRPRRLQGRTRRRRRVIGRAAGGGLEPFASWSCTPKRPPERTSARRQGDHAHPPSPLSPVPSSPSQRLQDATCPPSPPPSPPERPSLGKHLLDLELVLAQRLALADDARPLGELGALALAVLCARGLVGCYPLGGRRDELCRRVVPGTGGKACVSRRGGGGRAR